MIVIRRELPQSRNVGHRRQQAACHIVQTRMLRTAASPPGPERLPHHALRLTLSVSSLCGDRCALLGHRPHEPSQLACGRHHGDLVQLSPAHESPEFAMQAFLGFARDVQDFRRASLASLGQGGTGDVAVPVVPSRFNLDRASFLPAEWPRLLPEAYPAWFRAA